jgi:hypothetical protein
MAAKACPGFGLQDPGQMSGIGHFHFRAATRQRLWMVSWRRLHRHGDVPAGGLGILFAVTEAAQAQWRSQPPNRRDESQE